MFLTDQQIEGLERLREKYAEQSPDALRYTVEPFYGSPGPGHPTALTVVVYEFDGTPIAKHFVTLGGAASPRMKPDAKIAIGSLIAEHPEAVA